MLHKTGRHGVSYRITNFDIERTFPELAARAQEMVSGIDIDALDKTCKNSVKILNWVSI